jgi:hypothetical protein
MWDDIPFNYIPTRYNVIPNTVNLLESKTLRVGDIENQAPFINVPGTH